MAQHSRIYWKRLAWIVAAIIVLAAGSFFLLGKRGELATANNAARVVATSSPAPVARATRTVANAAGPASAPPPIWRHVDTVASDAQLLRPYATGWQTESKPTFAAFNNWAQRYVAATPDARATLAREGVTLAQARRGELAELIKNDPESALASAVPAPVRAQLPAEVAGLLEKRVAGRGDFLVTAVTPAEGQTVPEPVRYAAVIDKQRYSAAIFDRRIGENTKFNVPLHGITVDGQTIALHPSPVRVLDSGEVPSPHATTITTCPVSGKNTAVEASAPANLGSATVAEVGHDLVCFCDSAHLASYTQSLIAAENQPGPNVGGVSAAPASAYTTGNKKVLVIRVDFSDLPGDPITSGSAQDLMNNQVATFYDDASFHKTSLTVTVSSVTYRLPRTAQSYAVNDDNDSLHSDARAKFDADAANVTKTGGYDRVMVFFKYLGNITNSQIDYGGLGELGGPYAWINGEFDFRVCGHELGHTYGLYHANLWQLNAGVTNPVGAGSSLEYGDPFDTMAGGSTTPQFHFNPWFKNQLGWLDDARVTTITGDGVYRVYRFDDGDVDQTHTFAAVIDRGDSPGNHLTHHYYWIAFRKKISTSSALQNGAYIFWGYDYNRQSEFLDLNTPGANPSDGPLETGQTFTDSSNGVSIHPLSQGGTAPNQYIDVQVTFGNRLDIAQATYDVDGQLGSATVTVQRSGAGTGAISVHYATANVTATSPADYSSVSGTLNWADKDLAPKTVVIPITHRSDNEGTQSFAFNLSNITAGFLGRSAATVRINDPGLTDQSFTPPVIDGNVAPSLVQADGKILIGGGFANAGGSAHAAVARLNADGTLDTSFNALTIDGVIRAMAQQTDGKIIVSGSFTTVNGVTRHNIARLSGSGTLDATFDAGVGPDAEVRALALQPNGQIVIGGIFTKVANTARLCVARLESNGALDGTFTSPLVSDGNGDQAVQTIALQPDNNVLIGGLLSGSADVVMRLTPAGALDGNFAAVRGNAGSRTLAIAVEFNGNIVIGGNFTTLGGSTRNRIARLTPAGAVDGAFTASVDDALAFSASPQPAVRAIAVQNDGKVLLGGEFAKVDSVSASRIARVKADGSLDTIFAAGTGSDQPVNALIIQPNGRVIKTEDIGVGTIGPVTRFFAGVAAPGAIDLDDSAFVGFGGGGTDITLQRIGGSAGDISVNVATIGGTATPDIDFDPLSKTVTWADGDSAPKIVTVNIKNDNTNTGNEDFLVNLGTPIGTTLGAPAQADITIATGDVAPNRPVNTTPADGALDQALTPTLAASAFVDLNVGDFQTASQWIVRRASDSTMVFDSGRDTADFTQLTLPDALDTTTTYTWQVRYQDSHGVWSSYSLPTSFTTRSASVVQFSQKFFSVNENAGTAQVEVDRLNSTDGEVTVDFTTADETGHDPTAYLAQNGTLDFLDGESVKFITVPINNDPTAQGDKTFKVILDNITGVAQLGSPVLARVLIRDLQISSFLAAQGSYFGLIESADKAGYVSIQLTSRGSFTASFKYGGKSYKVRGIFDENGHFSALIPKSSPPLTLTLQLNTTIGNVQIDGTLSDALSNPIVQIVASRAVFTKNFPANEVGKYTVLIPADPAAGPQGTGFGALSVDAFGTVHFAGILGDGTKITQGAKLSQPGTWPFFVALYKNLGAIWGTLTFENIDKLSDVDGTLTWIKSGAFTVTPTLVGSAYIPPPARSGVRALPVRDGDGDARASFDGGDLSATKSALLTWDTANKIWPIMNTEFTTNFTKFKMKVSPATGLFSGSFLELGAKKPHAFSGAVFTKQLIGGGVFFGTTQAGAVKLVEVPKPL